MVCSYVSCVDDTRLRSAIGIFSRKLQVELSLFKTIVSLSPTWKAVFVFVFLRVLENKALLGEVILGRMSSN